MSLLTSQEKGLAIFLLCTAFIGAIIGAVRHDWFKHPEILLSPQNIPEVANSAIEKTIIEEQHSILNRQNDLSEEMAHNKVLIPVTESNIVSSELITNTLDNKVAVKKITNKKNTTQNPSKIININSASKEDLIKLPYIGDVKADRIIQFRSENGNFKSIKELEMVKGIGPKTLLKLEPFVTI